MDHKAELWRKILKSYPEAKLVEFHITRDSFGIVDGGRTTHVELSDLFDTEIEALIDAVWRLDFSKPVHPAATVKVQSR